MRLQGNQINHIVKAPSSSSRSAPEVSTLHHQTEARQRRGHPADQRRRSLPPDPAASVGGSMFSVESSRCRAWICGLPLSIRRRAHHWPPTSRSTAPHCRRSSSTLVLVRKSQSRRTRACAAASTASSGRARVFAVVVAIAGAGQTATRTRALSLSPGEGRLAVSDLTTSVYSAGLYSFEI